MFGFSQKERAAEALRRGAKCAMSGAYFHHTDAERFGLCIDATACLYVEALVHQIHTLAFLFARAKAAQGKGWNDPLFFKDCVTVGAAEFDKEFELRMGSLLPEVFGRISSLEAIRPPSLQKLYEDSARRVKHFDARTDETAICAALDAVRFKFMSGVLQMFPT